MQKCDIHHLASALKKDVWNPELTLIIVKKETMQFNLTQGLSDFSTFPSPQPHDSL